MRGNLKTLGLALVAALALSAIGASAAMAAEEHEFHSTVDDTVVTGTGNAQIFTINEGKLEFNCPQVHFEGRQVGKTADELTVGFNYTGGENGKCDSTSGKENTVVDDAGCHYRLDSDTTEGNKTGGEHANVTLTCPEEVLRVTGSLKITVPNQVIEHAVHYENVEGHVKVKATAHGIEWKCTSTHFACTLGLGVGIMEGNDGTYTGEVTAKGHVYVSGETGEVPGSYVVGEEVEIKVE